MQIKDVMTAPAIRIHPDETVTVAARTLAHYNIGILPVCGQDGRMQGLITDRDIVIRCLAAGRSAANTAVRDIMTKQVLAASPGTDVQEAARTMGMRQIRRLPVVENGRLCGVVSLGDLACQEETCREAGNLLAEISGNLSVRD